LLQPKVVVPTASAKAKIKAVLAVFLHISCSPFSPEPMFVLAPGASNGGLARSYSSKKHRRKQVCAFSGRSLSGGDRRFLGSAVQAVPWLSKNRENGHDDEKVTKRAF
jgi:hypothetical protein